VQFFFDMSKKARSDDEGAQSLCEEMQKVQDKIEEIEEEFDSKVLELQAQFNLKKKPFFESRNVIIQKLPNFWFQAFTHHRALEFMLQPEDEDIFKSLASIAVEEKEDIRSGFKIIFTFQENPYFSDTSLWKEVAFAENSDAAQLSQSGVAWKPGKNPSSPDGDAKPGAKRSRSSKSFFRFFEEAQKDHLFAANLIKDDLWPNPLKYYTGEIDDEDDDILGEEDDDDDSDGEVPPGLPTNADHDVISDDEDGGDAP